MKACGTCDDPYIQSLMKFFPPTSITCRHAHWEFRPHPWDLSRHLRDLAGMAGICNPQWQTQEAIDLLAAMLSILPANRPSAQEVALFPAFSVAAASSLLRRGARQAARSPAFSRHRRHTQIPGQKQTQKPTRQKRGKFRCGGKEGNPAQSSRHLPTGGTAGIPTRRVPREGETKLPAGKRPLDFPPTSSQSPAGSAMVSQKTVSRGKSSVLGAVGTRPAGIPTVAQRIPPRNRSPAGLVATTAFRNRAASLAESARVPRDAAVAQFPLAQSASVAESPAGIAEFLRAVAQSLAFAAS